MMSTHKRQQFIVREVRPDSELSLCLGLDHSYITDHVWQLDVREENEGLTVRFRVVRLPRPMSVPYPRDSPALAQSWQQRDCFLVAVTDDFLLGYVNMHVDAGRSRAWIHDLVVHQPFRRRRIGSALVQEAIRWMLLRQIREITLEMQTKNYPGIAFARALGFQFCGFNDRYYTNQDIAIFFGKTL